MTKGVLLLNLGTPKSYKTKDVRVFLREFLSDYRVIDLHPVFRFLLVNLFIAPFRAPKVAKNYKSIWTEQGSPLLVHSTSLRDKLKVALKHHKVELAMRYGEPSIREALQKLEPRTLSELIVVPLFPQYSSAATGSAIEKSLQEISKLPAIPNIKVISEFYNSAFYLDAMKHAILGHLEHVEKVEHIVFSYHGVPVKQVKSMEPKNYCNQSDPCPNINVNNQRCYRAQCYALSTKLAESIGFSKFSTCFQSRLGKTPWIKPYLEEHLTKLAKGNIKNICVVSPAFVVDCLETIDELGVETKEMWEELTGGRLELVPCLNDNDYWVSQLASIITA